MTITTVKETKINVKEEREAIRKFNERVRAVNAIIRANNVGLKKADQSKTIGLVPVCETIKERYNLKLTLTIEEKGVRGTCSVGASKVVIFWDATEEKWMGLYKGRGTTIANIVLDEEGRKFANKLDKAAMDVVKAFQLDKMNVNKNIAEIVDSCKRTMDATEITIHELEVRFGLVKEEPKNESKPA